MWDVVEHELPILKERGETLLSRMAKSHERTAPTLAANVMHFARMLRRAGLPVGPAETLAGQQALSLIDLGSRTEARTALRTAMIHRHEHQDVFDQAFDLFWRDPTAAEQAVAMALLEAQKEKQPERAAPGSRRVAEAMAQPREAKPAPRKSRR